MRYIVYEGSQQQIDVKQIFCDRLWGNAFLNIFSLMSKGGGLGGGGGGWNSYLTAEVFVFFRHIVLCLLDSLQITGTKYALHLIPVYQSQYNCYSWSNKIY
jgi:hypothetical protein